jgi:hypothetical protein
MTTSRLGLLAQRALQIVAEKPIISLESKRFGWIIEERGKTWLQHASPLIKTTGGSQRK